MIAPTHTHTSPQGVAGDQQDFRPFGQAMTGCAIGDHDVVSSIANLRFAGGPSDVAGLVVPVVVDPVEGEIGVRFPAHVGKEVFKRKPSVADGDAPASVVCVLFPVGVVDAHQHPLPRHVFGGAPSPIPDRVSVLHPQRIT